MVRSNRIYCSNTQSPNLKVTKIVFWLMSGAWCGGWGPCFTCPQPRTMADGSASISKITRLSDREQEHDKSYNDTSDFLPQ